MGDKWDRLHDCCEICEGVIDVLWAMFVAACVVAGIIFCFYYGIGHLNDSSDYGQFIDKSVVTECDLVSYNATVCMNISNSSNITVIGYEFVYESYTFDVCESETLWSHPDEVECGAGNSTLRQMNVTQCTIEDCESGLFYFGNEDIAMAELKKSSWWSGFWLILLGSVLIILCPCIVYCGVVLLHSDIDC